MQSVQESICANDIEGLDADALIPVELVACDVSSHSRPQDASTMVELGKQLLHSAKNGDTEAVRELMCRGAPFTTDWLGTSALHLAAQNNHLETAEVLLRAGISRDARTKVDRTPLHMAAYEGHHQMVQLLLNYGADVDSRDMLKMTPLHWAVEREHADIMHILLDHGADTNATSKFEKTPISLALEHDRLDLVDVLQQERVLIGIQAHQQSQANSAELEVATNNLVQLEAESNCKSSIIQEEEQQKFGIIQQQPQRKRKLSQAQIEKKQKMIFQQISISPNNTDGEQEKEIEDIEMINVNNVINSKKHKDIMSIGKQFRLLEAHGIRMIPVDEDDSSIVEKAMESGRTVVLTEAGKIALNLTKGPSIKRLQVASRKGTSRKVIAIRTDQIQSKILNPNSNTSTTTSRSPNILKKSTVDNKAKLFVTTVSNTSTAATISEIKNSIPTKEKAAISPTKIAESTVLQLDDDIEEITEEDNLESSEPVTDIAVLNKQLAEARRQAAQYRKQLQEKEKEAEIYKQQLETIAAQIASKQLTYIQNEIT